MKKIGISLLFIIGSINTSYGANANYCANYAKIGVIQQINNLKHNCGFTGLRWSPLYQGQRKWCLTVRQSIAEKEKKIRYQRLQTDCGLAPSSNTPWAKVNHWQQEKVIASVVDVIKKDDVAALKIFRTQKVNLKHEWEGNYGPPLYHAIDFQKFQAVRYLIKLDDPNRTSNAGPNPLSNILNDKRVNYSLLEFLLRNGSNPNGGGELAFDGSIPLNIAIVKNDLKAMRVLLRNGAKPNAFVDQPFLIKAIELNSFAAVKLLLQHGVNVNLGPYHEQCKNIKRAGVQLPLDYAQKKGNRSIIQLLKKRGAKTGAACLNP